MSDGNPHLHKSTAFIIGAIREKFIVSDEITSVVDK